MPSKWMYHHVYAMTSSKCDEKGTKSNETSGGTDSIVGQHPCQSAIDIALSRSSFKVCAFRAADGMSVRSLNFNHEAL